MSLFNPFRGAFGLDMSDCEVKVVQLKQCFGLGKISHKLNFKTKFSLPEGLIVDGQIQKPEIVIEHLKNHLFSKNRPHLEKPWVVASLPESKTFIKVITLKAPRVDLASQMIIEEASKHLPFALEEVYLDWHILTRSRQAKEVKILLAAAPKNIADSYTYLLNIAGMTPLAFEAESLVIARSVISPKNLPKNSAVAILDLDNCRSNFLLFDNPKSLEEEGSIKFSLTLPFSGHGKEELEDLSKKIKEAINFYQLHFPHGSPLKSVMICGDLAKLPGLEKSLALKLKLKTYLADPTINLLGNQKLKEELTDPSLAAAIGLAMRALVKPFNN